MSKPVALAMAQGIRQHVGATYGMGITGIAGPGGGTATKPVGSFHIALASKNKMVCNAYQFGGNRDAVRQRAVLAALDRLRNA